MKQSNDTAGQAIHFTAPPALAHPHSIPRRKPAQNDRSLNEYIRMLRKRKRFIFITAVILFGLCASAILLVPRTYRADVLVVLQSAGAAATAENALLAQPDMHQKLDAIREQVESRRTLSEVIQKYNLYADKRGHLKDDEIYEMMRRSITIKLGKSSFNLYFDHTHPKMAADVANELAQLYIKENKRLRNETLQNAARFIDTQADTLEHDVHNIEMQLQEYRMKHMGDLPEDVLANQALLTSLATQIAGTESNLNAEQLRKRKAEDRIRELLSDEIAQKQKNIKNLSRSIKQIDRLYDSIEHPERAAPGEPEPVSVSSTGNHDGGAPRIDNSEQGDIKERLSQTETDLVRARAAANGANTPDVVRLNGEKDNLLSQLAEAAPKAPPIAAPASADETEASDDIEIEMMRQQLHSRQAAVFDGKKNVEGLKKLLIRGMVAEIVVHKAESDLDRALSELKIQRIQIAQTRKKQHEDLENHQNELESLNQFRKSWSEMLVKIQEMEAQQLLINTNSTEDTITAAGTRIEKMAGDLFNMRRKQGDDFRRFLESHGEISRQMQEHENIMANLGSEQNDVRVKKARTAELEHHLTNSARVQVELPEMMRRYRTVTEQYEAMLKHKLQAQLAIGVETGAEGERMAIWDPAISNMTPYKPRYMTLFGGGFLGSLGLAIGMALMLELSTPKYLETDTLQADTGLHVLAHVAELSKREIPSTLPPGFAPSSAKIVTLYNPHQRLSKQFQDCACLLRKQGNARVIAVCSPGHGDGKTFVAANLAAAMAISGGEPVVLVDANLRSPALHTLFDAPLQLGLSEVLEGGSIIAHRLPSTAPCDLQLMTAGCAQRHGTVLLGSNAFREMMEKLSYEGAHPRIVLDTPSLKSGADVDVLLDAVDGVLLVIRRGHTPIAEVTRMLRRIPPGKLLGVIFNADEPA